MNNDMRRHLLALIGLDVCPAALLRAAQGPQIKEIAERAGVSYTLAWRVANKPISWGSKAEGTRAVRKAIQLAIGLRIWGRKELPRG